MELMRYRESGKKAPLTRRTAWGVLIHERAQDMPDLPVGRFARLPGDKRIFALACGFPAGETPGRVLASADGGATWRETGPFSPDGALFPTDSGVLAGTPGGVLVAAFSNQAEAVKSAWDPALDAKMDWRLPLYAVRSADGGRTWRDCRKLHEAWTGASRDIIRTKGGRLVLSTQKLLTRPGRHAVITYGSDDDGLTWTPGNLIDLGGIGHHGGVCEATLVELADGRLLMYIRTNWGQFWRAVSADGGCAWHPLGPAGIDASSAPGFLLRLADGRIALAWNRRFPEGYDGRAPECPVRGGDGVWSETPASNFRRELSISFSEDECETWSPPSVFARSEQGEISYPQLFEPEPGVLWVTAARFGLGVCLRVADFT